MEELSLFETDGISNQELTVTYTPNSSVSKYSIKVLKDKKDYKTYNVNEIENYNINLYETGNYEIIIT